MHVKFMTSIYLSMDKKSCELVILTYIYKVTRLNKIVCNLATGTTLLIGGIQLH